MIVIHCPYCTAKYKSSDKMLGKTFICKRCELKFIVSEDNRESLPFIADIVLKKKLINEKVLSKIIYYVDRMRIKGTKINLEEILISKGGISESKMFDIYNSLPRYDKKYADIAVNKNFATREEADKAAKMQLELFEKGTLKSIGKILIEEEVITERQHVLILNLQNERTDFEEVLKLIKVPANDKNDKVDKSEINRIIKENSELASFILKQNIMPTEKLNESVSEMIVLGRIGTKTNFEDYLISKKHITKELVNYHKKILQFKEIRNKDKQAALELMKEKPGLKKEIENALKKQFKMFSMEKRIERLKDYLPSKIFEKNGTEQTALKKTETVQKEVKKERAPELFISGDNLEAKITIPKADSTDLKDIISYEKVEKLMADAILKYGLTDPSEIKRQLSTNPFDAKSIVVAKGKPPKPTKHAEIKTYFQEEFLKAGKVNAFGMIDFRDRGEVPQVKKGELIAEKFPSEKGIPGTDIFGQPISVEMPMDDKLRGGTGTYFSNDNLKMYAKVDGQPSLVVGKIEIHEVHQIDGDVDYSTGHVVFNGNIVIPGKVLSGFKVKGVNVEVGVVDGGIISASGDVIVKNGIISGTVITKGSLTANFVSDSSINALGSVIIEKQLIDSKVATSSTVSIENGQIKNCQIVARQGVYANEIGSNHSKPCRIAVGTTEHIEREVHRLKKTILDNKTKLEESMEQIKSSYDQLKDIHADIVALSKKQNKNLQDEKEIQGKVDKYEKEGIKDKLVTQQAILATCVEKIDKMDKRLKSLLKSQDKPLSKVLEFTEPIAQQKEIIEQSEKDLADFEQWENENPGKAEVRVQKHINEGTFIKGKGSDITLKDHMNNCTIKEIQLDKKSQSQEDEEIEIEMEMIIEKEKPKRRR